jgi:hypothetical protein
MSASNTGTALSSVVANAIVPLIAESDPIAAGRGGHGRECDDGYADKLDDGVHGIGSEAD